MLTVASALFLFASAGKQYHAIDDGAMEDSGPVHGYALDYEETTTTESVTTTEPPAVDAERGHNQFDDERGKNKNKNKNKDKNKNKGMFR